uniref:Peroxisomal biogenesis factor 19 n=1 Tax=Anas platyrhynchos platyrhynchos TaxID=8840 RepID=A0A493T6I1_ANAPP
STEKSPSATAKDSLFASQEKFFQELFEGELASQATAEFEKAMRELAEEEPHLVEQFQKLSEAAGRVGLGGLGRGAGEGAGGAGAGGGRRGGRRAARHAEPAAAPAVQGGAVPLPQGDHREGEGGARGDGDPPTGPL